MSLHVLDISDFKLLTFFSASAFPFTSVRPDVKSATLVGNSTGNLGLILSLLGTFVY
jgi:hypothetical protein